MLPLIFLLTFAAVAASIAYFLQPHANTVRRRILEGMSANELARRRSAEGSAFKRLIQPAAHRIGGGLAQLLPQNLVKDVEVLLIQAGEPMSLSAFLTIWMSSSLISVLVVIWIADSFSLATLPLFLLGGFIITYGVALPYLLMRRRAQQRKKQIERALPDALDLLLTCVEAGLAVDAAFALVAQRSKGPLAEKLTEYLRQVGLGRSRQEALDEIAERSGAESLKRLSTVVAQAASVGTSMGDVLRIQAAELREARRLKAQEAAAKAPIWMTIPLALCFMPAMGAVILVPSILRMLDTLTNQGLFK